MLEVKLKGLGFRVLGISAFPLQCTHAKCLSRVPELKIFKMGFTV